MSIYTDLWPNILEYVPLNSLREISEAYPQFCMMIKKKYDIVIYTNDVPMLPKECYVEVCKSHGKYFFKDDMGEIFNIHGDKITNVFIRRFGNINLLSEMQIFFSKVIAVNVKKEQCALLLHAAKTILIVDCPGIQYHREGPYTKNTITIRNMYVDFHFATRSEITTNRLRRDIFAIDWDSRKIVSIDVYGASITDLELLWKQDKIIDEIPDTALFMRDILNIR